jgi:hypothetical protein
LNNSLSSSNVVDSDFVGLMNGVIVLDPEEQLGGQHDDADVAVSTHTALHTFRSSWSEVDTSGGGISPSARSLHSSALLNGVMYIFGMYDQCCWTATNIPKRLF